MKNQLRKLVFVVACLGFIISGCEKNLVEETLIKEVATQGKTELVTIKDVPFLIPSIVSFNNEYDYLTKDISARRSVSNLNLDLDHIIQYVYANNIKTYTVSVRNEFQPNEDKYFENLNVYEKNGVYESFVLRYNALDDSKIFDLKTFTGDLEIFDKNYVWQGVVQYENGLNKCIKIILGDWIIVFWGNGDISVGHCEGQYSGGNSGSWTGAGPTGGMAVSTSTSNNSGNTGSSGNNSYNSSTGNSYIPVFYPFPVPTNPAQFIYNLGPTKAAIFNSLKNNTQVLVNNYIAQNLNNPEELYDVKSLLSNEALMTKISQLSQDNQLSIFNYLITNVFSVESKSFVYDIINVAITETNQADINNLVGLTLAAKQAGNAIFEDSFDAQVDQYVDMDLSNPPVTPHLFGLHYFINIKKLQSLNPEWSFGKCMYEAGKPFIHLSLDAFGLIPVVGEVADLVNGALYTVEGDGVNATLSFASALPLVGYGATASKYAIKIKTAYATGNKVKLVWKVLPGNIVYFGTDATCRRQLRKALDMVVGNLNQAHHIIPLSLQTNPIVQKAFKSPDAFHLNEALNGISLSTLVHNGSHNNYTNKVISYLNELPANATPQQCYNKVTEIISKVRVSIANNPNTTVNNLIF